MSITVYSPFTGELVSVRPQDVGRAVKDRSDHMFYVLERPDGGGHYAAPTKAGGQRDVERYDAMVAKQQQARDTGAMGSTAQIAAASRSGRSSGIKWKLIIGLIVLAAAAAAAAWAVMFGPLKGLIATSP
ncbi:hypothetical protein HED60_07790 [Planctomycetales bacterium ZRK34]|nr:hypothetical protein HED60_07790 [Planctomycetales bacterium ZRK34]